MTLTLVEDLPCLGVIWCLPVSPIDLGVLQDSIRVSKVVGESWRRRVLNGHVLDICGCHSVISICNDLGYLMVHELKK